MALALAWCESETQLWAQVRFILADDAWNASNPNGDDRVTEEEFVGFLLQDQLCRQDQPLQIILFDPRAGKYRKVCRGRGGREVSGKS